MKRCLIVTLTLLLVGTAGLRADLKLTNTMTITGGPMAQMAGGMVPQMTMYIKGSRMRMDMEVMGNRTSNIIDAETKQVIMLMHAQKTAQMMDIAQMAAKAPAGMQMPKMDAKVEPTGQSKDIDGRRASEYRYSMTIDMSSVGSMGMGPGGQPMPAGAAEMLKGVKMLMNGSMWVAKEGPGVAEYVAFAKAGQKYLMGGLANIGSMPGGPGMDEMMRAFAQLEGMPLLSEIEMAFEGDNPMVEMMKSMGAMKITTRLTEVSTQAIADDMFQVPADYTVTKPQ